MKNWETFLIIYGTIRLMMDFNRFHKALARRIHEHFKRKRAKLYADFVRENLRESRIP